MSNSTGRGKFTPIPFNFTYTVNNCTPVQILWQGRGRLPSKLLDQIDWEKTQNNGVSSTEQALEMRDPRKTEAAAEKARLEKIREERKSLKAERELISAQRKAERLAKRQAAAEGAIQAGN